MHTYYISSMAPNALYMLIHLIFTKPPEISYHQFLCKGNQSTREVKEDAKVKRLTK